MRTGRYLDAVARRPDAETGAVGYPFTLPLVRDFVRLAFPTAVTFFVGENGSGKSTLLEAIAMASGAVALGSRAIADDPTLAGPRALAGALVIERTARPRTRVLLRAEDVFGFASRTGDEMREAADEQAAIEAEGPIRPGSGRERARGVHRAAHDALAATYGADPHARSHGELFLTLLRGRLTPGGLYFLDEPETPLSPTRVLALIAMLLDGVREGSQFVVATHSPILTATPDATIYAFRDDAIAPVAWDETEHVATTRAFLRDPLRYLRHLV